MEGDEWRYFGGRRDDEYRVWCVTKMSGGYQEGGHLPFQLPLQSGH